MGQAQGGGDKCIKKGSLEGLKPLFPFLLGWPALSPRVYYPLFFLIKLNLTGIPPSLQIFALVRQNQHSPNRRHHQLNGLEFEQALGVGDGQGSLACCTPWGHKELDTTEGMNWTDELELTESLNFACFWTLYECSHIAQLFLGLASFCQYYTCDLHPYFCIVISFAHSHFCRILCITMSWFTFKLLIVSHLYFRITTHCLVGYFLKN